MSELDDILFDLAYQEGKTVQECLYDVYCKGRADYQAECEKLFEENPPMHFTPEQIMWVKERIKLQYQQGRADERKCLEIAFNKLFGSEYSWWEVVNLAEQLMENNNDSVD